MNKLLVLAWLLLAVLCAPANAQSTMNAILSQYSAAISGNSAVTAKLVSGSTSQTIYVTQVNFMAGGAANVTLVYGTGTNCGTGQVALTGAYPLAAQAQVSLGAGNAPVLIVPAGNDLCWINSAAVQVSGSLAYAQF